ncbi:MAG: alpha-ribazole phosphatase [Actinobacteria bacterium]|nr:alpha-ribazole phosphatase [Actinomycetota bacterium]MBU4301612.1 alpha-ribazole phosphatase [Actinomycetota bacterium]MBU4386811.1 alpha-ribazole phosphatase [Actinomycetota bacterium]MBU4489522.1 alpha-ribazole phosphatase [Actinomycetota bacterium]
MTRVILVRHGRTAWHAEGRYTGITDIPLDEMGRTQAKSVAVRLHDVEIDRVYSSPLSRCLELAETVAGDHGIPVEVDERLREINLGRWDGETYKEIFEKDGDLVQQWTRDPSLVNVPGGESLAEVQERTVDWLKVMLARYPDCTILASSHGGAIRALIAGVIGLHISRLFRLTIDLASISVLDYQGEFSSLGLLNETGHLHPEGSSL